MKEELSDTDKKALKRYKEEGALLWQEFEYQFSQLEKEYSVKVDLKTFVMERLK